MSFPSVSRLRSLRRLRFLLVPLAVLVLGSCNRSITELPTEAELVAEITPGKPGAPRESVAIIKREQSCLLRVRRIGDDGHVMAEAEVSLSLEDFAQFWQLIETKQLPSLKVDISTAPIVGADFGTRSIKLDWVGQDRPSNKRSWALEWDRPPPVQASDKLQSVLVAFGQLAERLNSKAAIYYFPKE